MSNIWECSVATFYNKLSIIYYLGWKNMELHLRKITWYNTVVCDVFVQISWRHKGGPRRGAKFISNTWEKNKGKYIFVFFKINKGTVSDITLQASWYDIKLWLDSYSIKQDSTFKRSVHMKSKTHHWIPRHNSLI